MVLFHKMNAQVYLQLVHGASQAHSQDKLEKAQTSSLGNVYGAGREAPLACPRGGNMHPVV